MRNAMPMRWIEQREARQVLAMADFEPAATMPWSNTPRNPATRWLPRLGAWLIARHPLGFPATQLQPVAVRCAPSQVERRRADDDDYFCRG